MITGILIGIGITLVTAFLIDHFLLRGLVRGALWFLVLYTIDKFLKGGNPLG